MNRVSQVEAAHWATLRALHAEDTVPARPGLRFHVSDTVPVHPQDPAPPGRADRQVRLAGLRTGDTVPPPRPEDGEALPFDGLRARGGDWSRFRLEVLLPTLRRAGEGAPEQALRQTGAEEVIADAFARLGWGAAVRIVQRSAPYLEDCRFPVSYLRRAFEESAFSARETRLAASVPAAERQAPPARGVRSPDSAQETRFGPDLLAAARLQLARSTLADLDGRPSARMIEQAASLATQRLPRASGEERTVLEAILHRAEALGGSASGRNSSAY